MYKIDSNQGRFITVVPDTRRETGEFAKLVYQSVIRWKEILRKKSTIERDIRLEMKNKGVEKIKILPEQRPTGTPTREQICRIFENIFHYELYSGKKTLKTFSDNLLPNQLVVLDLLKIPKNKFYLN